MLVLMLVCAALAMLEFVVCVLPGPHFVQLVGSRPPVTHSDIVYMKGK